MNPALSDLAHRILGALCNGGYQGILVTGLVALTLRLWRQANAATRYAIEFATLLVVAALPVLHFAFASPALPPIRPAELLENPMDPPDARASSLAPAQPDPSATAAEPSTVVPVPADAFTFELATLTLPVPVEPDDRPPAATEFTSAPASSGPRWRAALPGVVSVLLVGFWGLFAAVRLAGLGVQLARLRQMKRRSLPAEGDVAGLFAAIRDEAPVTREAALRVSPAVTSPVAVGYCRPAILVSPLLVEDAGVEWEGILRHELAHLRRRDDWTNLLQQLIKSAYFLHPAIWWLDRRLTVDREIACDDHVLAAMRSPGDYALLLADLAGRLRGPAWTAAPAAWNHPSQLKERIHMILDTHRNASPRVVPAGAGLVGTLALLTALLALHAAPRLAVAEDAPPPAEAVAPVAAVPATPPEPPEPPQPTLIQDPAGNTLAVVTSAPSLALSTEVRVATDSEPLTSDAPKHKDRPAKVHRSAGTATVIAAPAAPAEAPSPDAAPRPTPVPKTAVIAIHKEKEKEKDKDADGTDRFERRLERLERLVESLKRKETGANIYRHENLEALVRPEDLEAMKAKARAEADRLREQARNFEKSVRKEAKDNVDTFKFNFSEDMAHAFDGKALGELLGQVSRQVEQATRDAMKAAAAAAQAAKLHGQESEGIQTEAEALKLRRHALDEQRRALQKQIGSIERQLERLNEQLERVDDRLDKAGDAAEKAHKAAKSAGADNQPKPPERKPENKF